MRMLSKRISIALLAIVILQMFTWESGPGFFRMIFNMAGFLLAIFCLLIPDDFEF